MQVICLFVCWYIRCFIQFIVRYWILTLMSVKTMVLQNLMLCNSAAKYQHFRRTTLRMETAGFIEMSVTGSCLPSYMVSHLRRP